MKLLNRFSIRAKMIFGFGLVLLVTLGLGVFALQRLGSVNNTAVEVRDNWLSSTRLLGLIEASLKQHRIYELRHVVSSDGQAKAAREADMRTERERLTKLRAEYEPLVSAGEERRLIDAFDHHLQAYFDCTAELLALSRQGNGTALAFFEGTSLKIYFDAVKAIETDMDYNTREGGRAADRGAAAYASAHT